MSVPADISVLVTTFNKAPYLGATLDSIRRQSLRPREVIVVDDGSTDETPAVLQAFADVVTVIRQPNRGVAAARNTAVQAASGELLALIDGDDLWHPDRLARLQAAYASNPDVGLIVTEVECFEDAGGVEQIGARSDLGARFGSPGEIWRGRCFDALLFEGCLFWTPSQVAVPRKVLLAIGPSDTRFRIASDYDLYVRIAERYDVLVVKQHLTKWRQVSGSVSGAGIGPRFVNWRLDSARVVSAHRAGLSGAARRVYDEAYQTHRERLLRYVYDRAQTDGRVGALADLVRIAAALGDGRALAYAAGLCVPPRVAAALGRALGMGR